MAKKKSITRISDKKRGRPKIRFSIWGLILIFTLSFAGCFIIYMLGANINENFWSDEFDKVIIENKADGFAGTDTADEDAQADVNTKDDKSVSSNPVVQSEAKTEDYLDSCCLVTDSLHLGIDKCTELKDVIGSDALGAASCNSVTIETAYGNNTVYETLNVKKPQNVYIMLGNDIGVSAVDDMIAAYNDLVKNLRGSLTTADIYVMQLPPVSDGNEKANNALINEFNTKLLSMANLNHVYCLDTNTALKGADGNISEEYTDAGSGSLNENACKKIVEYLLCHTV